MGDMQNFWTSEGETCKNLYNKMVLLKGESFMKFSEAAVASLLRTSGIHSINVVYNMCWCQISLQTCIAHLFMRGWLVVQEWFSIAKVLFNL